MAVSEGWDVVSYSIKSPPFRFRRLDELDLGHIDFESLRQTRPTLLNLSNASQRVLDRVKALELPYRGVRVLRDPRQILISNYFHHLDGHNLEAGGWVWDKLKEDRAILQRLDREDGIVYELNNITGELLDTQIFGWESPEEVLEVKLEEFGADPKLWIGRIEEHLGARVGAADAPANSYANPFGRTWRECFTDRIREVFKHRYGEPLIRLGYAQDLNW
jgi:hypothetical protein